MKNLPSSVLAGLALLAVLPGCALPLVAEKKPNVILVITDDQGYGDVGFHGNRMIQTPVLDALAAQSLRLTDFHVDPTCSPTRAALMTGRYSTRTGVWHTIMGRSLMRGSEQTIAEALQSAGYRTGMFGKWHLGENHPLRPQDQGFDVAVHHGGGGVGQGPDYWENDYFDDTYWRNGVPEKFTGYCTDIWFDEAMKFVEANRDEPFFAYVSTNAPHGPLNVDAKWSEPYRKKGVAPAQAKFYGMIENIDWNLGRLLQQLDRLKLAEDTIVIFMTDNGTAAGRVNRKLVNAGKWGGFNAGMRGNKGSEFDGGHRVPFFVRWPGGGIGGADAGREDGYLCAHIDVLPTLLGLCGVGRPGGPPLDGMDLSPRMKHAGLDLPTRTLFVHSQRVPDPIKWRKCAVMTERWRLVNGKQLFDIQADPGQKNDIAGRNEAVVKRLTRAYDAWWESLRPSFERPVRIALGSPAELVTQLHPHDWHVANQRLSSWHQRHVKQGHLGQGKWFVQIERAGAYEFELRRWPRHVGGKLDATKARLVVGDEDREVAVPANAEKVAFQVELAAGPTTVQTTMSLPNGKQRGAYFVYVRRL